MDVVIMVFIQEDWNENDPRANPAVAEAAIAQLEHLGFTNVVIFTEEMYGCDGTATDPSGADCLLEIQRVNKNNWTDCFFPFSTILYANRYAVKKHTQPSALAKKPCYHLQINKNNHNIGVLTEWSIIRAYGIQTPPRMFDPRRGQEVMWELSRDFGLVFDITKPESEYRGCIW